jgi:hypothetical protein
MNFTATSKLSAVTQDPLMCCHLNETYKRHLLASTASFESFSASLDQSHTCTVVQRSVKDDLPFIWEHALFDLQ